MPLSNGLVAVTQTPGFSLALSYTVYVDREREPRVTIAVRISAGGLRAIDERAEDEDRSRSEMVRRMLAYAVWKMPKGWRP